jgi:hypothetical protein
VKKNITKSQGQGQKGEYKILVVSRDKKGNKLAKKGTIIKAFGYECWLGFLLLGPTQLGSLGDQKLTFSWFNLMCPK